MTSIEKKVELVKFAMDKLDPNRYEDCTLVAKLLKRNLGSDGERVFCDWAERGGYQNRAWAQFVYRSVTLPAEQPGVIPDIGEPHNRLAADLERAEQLAAEQNKPTLSFGQVDENYIRLAAVFDLAYDQAANGKGHERHANGLPFHDQRMQRIARLQGSAKGMAYQVHKKIEEALELPTRSAKIRELLGAINYLAGVVIFIEDTEPEDGGKS